MTASGAESAATETKHGPKRKKGRATIEGKGIGKGCETEPVRRCVQTIPLCGKEQERYGHEKTLPPPPS